MRMLTKAEACRELGLSLSTLDRRIAAGELQARREPHGRWHRVYVALDDDPPGSDNNAESGSTALAVAQERIRGLEAEVEYLQEQLALERQRNGDLVNDLKAARTSAAQEQRGPRWRFWQRGGDRRGLPGQAGRGMMDSKTI